MIVQSRSQAHEAPHPRRRRRTLWAAALVAVLLGWTALSFAAGFGFRDFIRPSLQALTGRTQLSDAVDSMVRAPGRWLRARLDPAPVEQIHLDIRFRHLTKIHEKRAEALERGLLVTGPDDMVPAEIRYQDRTLPVKVRLKGDLPDHLETDKWSFRIQVRRGQALFGMRRFSVQAPRTRGYQGEPLFLQTLRWEDVLAPRYFFVDVTLNGKDLGLMALEEHFSKELLESQERRESVILKFDESLFWENVLLNGTHGPYDSYRTAPVAVFQEGKVSRTPALAAARDEAMALLRGFADGRLDASDVFDVERLGRFLAVCELWGAYHPVRWHNLRFYFDPIDRELEPIGFDGNLQAHYLGRGLLAMEEPISRRFLEDAAVRAAYVRALHRLAEDAVEGSLVARLQQEEKRWLRVLHQEFPFRAPIDFGPLRARAAELRFVTAEGLESFEIPAHRPDRPYPAVVAALVVRQDGAPPALELRNLVPHAVVVREVRVVPPRRTDGAPAAPVRLPGFPRELAPTPRGAVPASVALALPDAAVLDGATVEGVAAIAGESRSYPFRGRPAPPAASAPAIPEAPIDALLARHAFLARAPGDAPDRGLVARPGTWRVDAPVVLPEGVALELPAGTTLRFGPDAVLVVLGPLHARGTEARPVVLEAAAPGATWPGLVVLGTPEAPSEWSHVRVEGTSGFRLGGWTLTGGVTFYETRVVLDHVAFERARGEDGLNLVRTRFEMIEPLFRDTASDAFDGDFVHGRVEGGRFEAVGGDALDVSGSHVEVRGTVFARVRDKAISVGEGSVVDAREVTVDGAGTGVASKDRSQGKIQDSVLRNIEHVALMAYVKKPEYGPASLFAENVRIEGAAEPALAQTGSRVVIDGQDVPPADFDVEQVYREGYMRK